METFINIQTLYIFANNIAWALRIFINNKKNKKSFHCQLKINLSATNCAHNIL